MYFGKAIKFWSSCTGGVHFPVTDVTESSLVFNVPECLGKFIFEFGGRVLGDDVLGIKSLPVKIRPCLHSLPCP